MPQWNDLQSHLHALVEKGKQLARAGMEDAQYLLGATANATRLHVAIRRDQIAKHRLLHELGRELWQAILADERVGEIRVTESMREKVRRIEALESEIRIAEQETALLSVVRRDDEEPPSADEPPSDVGKTPSRKRRPPKEAS